MKRPAFRSGKAEAAGILIGIGCCAYLSLGCGLEGAAVFSLGLMGILANGLQLYTGSCGYVIYKDGWSVLELIAIFLLNAGSVMSVALAYACAGGDIEAANAIALSNCPGSFVEYGSFALRSVMCGMMMHLAVATYRTESSGAVKAVVVALCVVTFLSCGFEHSVANVFYYVIGVSCGTAKLWPCLAASFVAVVGNCIGAVVLEELMTKKEDYEQN